MNRPAILNRRGDPRCREVRIPMDDGVALAATLYLPPVSNGPQPCILEALPYRKDDLTSSYRPDYARLRDDHGFAVCRLDLRGTGSSGGDATDEYPPREQRDLHAVMEWLVEQEWCDGNLGMYGTSYSACNSLQMACERPEQLKAIIAIYGTDDRYTDDVHYRGGVLKVLDLVDYCHYMTPMNALPAVPAVWGDGWRDEWLRRIETDEPWAGRPRRSLPEDGVPAMGRHKVEVRREEILAATIGEIERSGMSSLRVSDVASSLGVSSGLVFYHFATKNALLVEALEYAVVRDANRLDKALAKSGEPVERLRGVLTSYGPTGAAQGWTPWIEAWSTALREPSIRASLRKLDKRWRDALEHVIAEGVTSGDFSCPDPPSAVARVGALLDGLSVAALIYQTVTRKQLQSWVRNATADEIGIDRARLTLSSRVTPDT